MIRKAIIFLCVIIFVGVIIPPITSRATTPTTACQATYVVQSDDWLSKVADKHFGNLLAYPLIMAATNQQAESDATFKRITHPDIIEIGWKLCIPTIEGRAPETILQQVSAPPPTTDTTSNPETETAVEPPPPAPAVRMNLVFPNTQPDEPVIAPATPYNLDRFVSEFPFSPDLNPSWIYSSPAPVARYAVSEEYQTRNDLYGYRANYWWNEYLSDTYFRYSGIFDVLPPEVWVYRSTWGSAFPRYRYPTNVTLPAGLTTNQYGWRGQPISLNKPANTIRIAAVGASTTVSGHSYPYSYPELLQHWLNMWAVENGYAVNFEVINAGREGIGAQDLAAVVRYEILPMEVDYVIYYEGANQFNPRTTVNYSAEVVYGQPPPGIVPNTAEIESDDKGVLDQLSEYSALAARARNVVEQFLLTGEEPPKPVQQFILPEGLDELRPERDKLGNVLDLRTILANLDGIKRDVDSSGARLVMTTFDWFAHDGMVIDPSRHRYLYIYLNRKYWPITYANMRRSADFQNRVFQLWAAQNNVPLVDVAGQMPRQPDLYNDAIHNNVLGMKIRAWINFEALVPLIKRDIDNGLYPRPDAVPLTEHPYIKSEYDLKLFSDDSEGSVSENVN